MFSGHNGVLMCAASFKGLVWRNLAANETTSLYNTSNTPSSDTLQKHKSFKVTSSYSLCLRGNTATTVYHFIRQRWNAALHHSNKLWQHLCKNNSWSYDLIRFGSLTLYVNQLEAYQSGCAVLAAWETKTKECKRGGGGDCETLADILFVLFR